METLDCLLNHRSIRRFRDQPVPESVLQSVLEAASRCSTTGNMQVYSIIRTEDPERKKELQALHFGQRMVGEAPVILTFLADFHRFNKWCELRGAEPCYDNFMSFLTAAMDALLASQNAAVAAEDHGLGICYVGTTPYQADKLIAFFGLPEGVVPITALALGYPAEEPPLTDRLPLEAIVHRERYTDFDEEGINRLYAEKESLEANKAFVEENGLENLAEVFTKIRYPREMKVNASRALLETLRKQGFMNQ